mgnify:CR=1 FL=1
MVISGLPRFALAVDGHRGAQAAGDLAELATLNSNLATVKGNLGQVPDALALAERSLALQAQLGTQGQELVGSPLPIVWYLTFYALLRIWLSKIHFPFAVNWNWIMIIHRPFIFVSPFLMDWESFVKSVN